ncbi:MAG TPA: aspartyl/asparaginyl beta-hydroxylase domain-containing protein [Rudaea sp.]|nr:aspartyl/asparaginyl beta-hydroxylase domain-containing protein [Rudaea sp.]
MITLPGHPLLDKTALIGGCARLPVRVDAERLQAEVASIPAELWLSRGGRVGVHNPAQAIFLRGHAPAEGNLPIEDREALRHVPYVREFMTRLIAAQPLRCLLARLPGGAIIAAHTDQAEYFSKTIRIHVPVTTHATAWMYCAGRSYRMQPGEVWALNNSTQHGVWNADPERSRTHLICDFLTSPALLDLLARAERDLGTDEAAVYERVYGLQPAAGSAM